MTRDVWVLTSYLALTGCASTEDCEAYVTASVAELRSTRGSGCFQLEHVVVVARTPSGTTPRAYLQDPMGGDFSALMAKCATDGRHPCPKATAESVHGLLQGSTVTARGYYHQGTISGFEELYLDAVIDEGRFTAEPLPAVLTAEQVAKSARHPEAWFQMVSVEIPAADPWVISDMSPSELNLGPDCPNWGGFGMVPASHGPADVPDCSNGINPPSAVTSPVAEVLIGRQFYDGFWASTDCACALEHHQHLLSPFSTLVGTIQGVLLLEQSRGAAYQVFEPVSKATFPVSGG